jgi:hypothetical protein
METIGGFPEFATGALDQLARFQATDDNPDRDKERRPFTKSPSTFTIHLTAGSPSNKGGGMRGLKRRGLMLAGAALSVAVIWSPRQRYGLPPTMNRRPPRRRSSTWS